MKKIFFLLLVLIVMQEIRAQNVGIGTTTPNGNAALEIRSNNKGLLMPRLSTTARNTMASVSKGMLVYDTTRSNFYYHDGGSWRMVGEPNYDSLLNDNSGNPQVTHNMSNGGGTTLTSGILYDNGGPAGNYANNSNEAYTVVPPVTLNDSMIGYKIIVEEMDLESPYDSLEIHTYYGNGNRVVLTGTTTGTFYILNGADYLYFVFKSNAVNSRPGFKIRWAILTTKTNTAELPPTNGLYFNQPKTALRGGIPGGSINGWSTENLGRYSFSYGVNARASGEHSIATGLSSQATGYGSVAIGYRASASGVNAFALGSYNEAAGNGSVAIGNNNSVNGNDAVALGENNTASGNNSFAIGDNSIASVDHSIAMGYSSSASGGSAVAIGYDNTASGTSSAAFGRNTTAAGSFSSSFGSNTLSRSYAGIAIGMYNDPVLAAAQTSVTSTTPLFIIGNGDNSSTLSNAMVVLKNGNVGIGANAPDANLHIQHAAGGGIILENTNDNNKWRIYSASGDNNLTFYNNAGTEIADIDDVTGAFSALSDGRYKKNIQRVGTVLPLLMQLDPKYYHFNWQQPVEQMQIGFIAQEAYKLFPELVSYSKEKDLYKMNYAAFSIVAIKAIQEQQQEIEELKTRLEKLEALIKK